LFWGYDYENYEAEMSGILLEAEGVEKDKKDRVKL
jgi:hypothetical protein